MNFESVMKAVAQLIAYMITGLVWWLILSWAENFFDRSLPSIVWIILTMITGWVLWACMEYEE